MYLLYRIDFLLPLTLLKGSTKHESERNVADAQYPGAVRRSSKAGFVRKPREKIVDNIALLAFPNFTSL